MKSLRSQFEEFHQLNPGVFNIFEKFTFDAIHAGRKHLGAQVVFERMRWYTNVESKGDDFKLNNNHVAFYTRMFEDVHPAYKGFFRTRVSAADYLGGTI